MGDRCQAAERDGLETFVCSQEARTRSAGIADHESEQTHLVRLDGLGHDVLGMVATGILRKPSVVSGHSDALANSFSMSERIPLRSH
jgi:hypothetical protein